MSAFYVPFSENFKNANFFLGQVFLWEVNDSGGNNKIDNILFHLWIRF